MTAEHQASLRKNTVNLVSNMTPQPLIEHLYSSGALSSEEMETVKAESTLSNKNRALLDILRRKPDSAFRKLKEALVETEQDFIANML